MCIWYAVCPIKKATEQRIIPKTWIKNYCLSDSHWKNCIRYQMEESGIPHSDDMLPNGTFIQR